MVHGKVRQFSVITALFLIIFPGCLPRDNPYDPANPDFTMPQFSCTIHLRDDVTTDVIPGGKEGRWPISVDRYTTLASIIDPS